MKSGLLRPPERELEPLDCFVLGWAAAWLANEGQRFSIPDSIVRDLARRGWISFLGPRETGMLAWQRPATLTPEGRRQVLSFSTEVGIA